MALVLQPNQVELFGTRFYTRGPVRDQVVNPLPAKIKFGDYTREDDVLQSSWMVADYSGGLGITQFGDPQQYSTRYWFALAETRHPRQLGLLPLVSNQGALAGVTQITTFNGQTLLAEGGTLVVPNESGGFTVAATLSAPPLESVLYKGVLYFALGSTHLLQRYDGASVSDCAPLSGSLNGASMLTTFEDKLIALGSDNAIYWTIDGDVWTKGGSAPVGSGHFNQVLTYFDESTLPAIHAIGKDGLWGYDFDTGIWARTPLIWPLHPYVGRATVWRGILYCPVGMSVYSYNGTYITNMGPDRDEGLPAAYNGYIKELVPTHAYLYCVVNSIAEATGALSDVLQQGSPWHSAVLPPVSYRGLLLAGDGNSWHAVWQSDIGIVAIGLSDGEQAYRLWWASGGQTYSTDLPVSLPNPLSNPSSQFEPSGYVISSWFDAQWSEIDKLAISLRVRGRNLSASERYEIRAQFEDEDAPWELLGQSQGSTRKLRFLVDEASGGRLFRRLRLRIDLFRGSDPKRSPIIDHVTLNFTREPYPLWSYSFTLDLTKACDGQTPRQQRAALKAAITARKTFWFAYTDPDRQTPQQLRVKFARSLGTSLTGLDKRSLVNLSVIEIESEDGS